MNDSLHLVCPHCHTVNRVSAARPGQAPGCGRCYQALFKGGHELARPALIAA